MALRILNNLKHHIFFSLLFKMVILYLTKEKNFSIQFETNFQLVGQMGFEKKNSYNGTRIKIINLRNERK